MPLLISTRRALLFTPTAAPPTLTTGLVGYWDMDERTVADTNDIRYDCHGIQDFVDINSVGIVTGKRGHAAHLVKASGEYMFRPNNTTLQTGDIDFTVAGWVYFLSLADNPFVFAKEFDSSNREWRLDSFSNTLRFFVFNSSNGVAGTVSSGALSTGTWYYVEAWHSATDNQVGIRINNGTAITAGTSSAGAVKTANLYFGSPGAVASTQYLDGYLDEWGYWKKLLSEEERTYLYNNGNGRTYTDFSGQEPNYVVKQEYDIANLYVAKTGGVTVRYMYDVDGDGVYELVTNPGSEARFVAIKEDGTEVWDTTVNATRHQFAYYPKVLGGHLYYGDRNAAKVYKIRLSDGVKVWESGTLTGLVGMDISDQGVVVGYGTSLDILSYSTGSSIGGAFPINTGITIYEQTIAAGDLDGDGNDEFFCNDTNSTLKAYDDDGSLMLTITLSPGTNIHTDIAFIGDFYASHSGNELLINVNDDDSATSGSEGDELALFDATGSQLKKYTASGPGVEARAFTYGGATYVAFAVEDGGEIGLLNGELVEQWTVTSLGGSGSTSQIQVADLDGDGVPEIFTNTAEDNTASWIAFDLSGNELYRIGYHGWDFDPPYDYKTSELVQQVDMTGDGRANLIPGLLNYTTESGENCTVYVWGWGAR